jgi:hypothetical protein
VQKTTALPNLPAGTEAWAGRGCDDWTDIGGGGTPNLTGETVIADTGLISSSFCFNPHPIACCALVP